MPDTRDQDVRRALSRGGVIDITTTGRRSGAARRIEIAYHVFDDRIYISGMPSHRRRSWMANLEADPRLTVHLKQGVIADVTATARIIGDESERRAVLAKVQRAWRTLDLETMVRWSPLIEVTIDGSPRTSADETGTPPARAGAA
jgi:deazaflavin-dependent oxidoreductase (nitroreductase family)